MIVDVKDAMPFLLAGQRWPYIFGDAVVETRCLWSVQQVSLFLKDSLAFAICIKMQETIGSGGAVQREL